MARLADTEQVPQDALADVANVEGTVLEVAILELFEVFAELGNGTLEGGFGAQAFVDQGVDARDQGFVLEHHALGVENRRLDLVNGLLTGEADVRLGARGLTFRPFIARQQVHRFFEALLRRQPLLLLALQPGSQLHLRQQSGNRNGDGTKQPYLGGREAAAAGRLDDQHAE
jgi:hypothetical protein